MQTAYLKDNKWHYVIDWADLKKVCLSALDYNMIVPASRAHNREQIRKYAQGDDDRSGNWCGYNASELKEWIERGYRVESLRNIANPPIKIRDKRKTVYGEEGDEFHYDLAMSGDDRPFSSQPKIPAMPGVSLEIAVSFLSTTRAEVISQYVKWALRGAYSIEAAGIDLEVNLDYGNDRTWDNRRTVVNVRVKREGLITDFNSWSPILSPASLRCFGFVARTMGADSTGVNVNSNQGYSVGEKWDCFYDPKRKVIRMEGPKSPREFPELDMTDKLRDALDDLNKSSN